MSEKNLVGQNWLLLTLFLGPYQCLVASCVRVYYTVNMSWVTATSVGMTQRVGEMLQYLESGHTVTMVTIIWTIRIYKVTFCWSVRQPSNIVCHSQHYSLALKLLQTITHVRGSARNHGTDSVSSHYHHHYHQHLFKN